MTQTNHINRRKALTIVAAAPAAVALSTSALASDDGSHYAALGGGPRCYMLQCNADDCFYPAGSTYIIDPDRMPKDDDLVHAEHRFGTGLQHITAYSPRGGHDEHGRFVTPGSPNEMVCVIAPIKYSRAEIDRGLAKILGTVCAVLVKL